VPLVHDDPDFDHLLRIVAARRGLAVGLVEKDYWVTHVLWSLHDRGFEVWFKGGTSLSKGFGLIERFSEDLDLKIEPGHVADLPLVTDWHRESRRATDQRRAYFEALPDLLRVPGADAGLALGADGTRWTGANIELRYPVRHAEGLGPLRPFVLLEVGSARVTPSVERDLTSFVHEYLGATDRLGDYDDNRPRAVRCVHPLVTLVEKLDNLHTRVPRDDRDPATFVRHFEDAARIIAAVTDLPPLAGYADISGLVDDMLAERQIRQQPASNDPAFAPGDDSRWRAIRGAHAAIAPMFWGERIDLDAACATLRDWIASTLERR
jgi:hypothetical protein